MLDIGGLRLLCLPAMFIAESLLALCTRWALRAGSHLNLQQLSRSLGLLRASNYLAASPPDVGSQ